MLNTKSEIDLFNEMQLETIILLLNMLLIISKSISTCSYYNYLLIIIIENLINQYGLNYISVRQITQFGHS